MPFYRWKYEVHVNGTWKFSLYKSNLIFFRQEKLFMLFGEVIDDCSENHAQHTISGQSEEFLSFLKCVHLKTLSVGKIM
jgi:hypothetical protein